MSAAETEVAEAIVESEEPSFDMEAAVEELGKDVFGATEKPVEEETEEEVEEVAEEVKEEPEPEPEKLEESEAAPEDLKEAPKSWKKEMHEEWGKLGKEAQDYIELREEQMKEGVDVRKEDAELGMRMRDAFQPFDGVLKKNNVDPVTASQRLMATHLRMMTAPAEEKKQLFNQLAQSYGVTTEPVDDETQKMMNNPLVKQLMDKVNHLEKNVTVSQQASQQERETQVNSKVESFAAEHPYFDDLSDNIARLIRADYSLEDAYDMAFKNSQFYEKELESKREAKQEKDEKAKKLEADKAKKAKSVNVRGRDTKKAPTGPLGTMDDTMRDVMREIKNRN